jgi:hypothetical protein
LLGVAAGTVLAVLVLTAFFALCVLVLAAAAGAAAGVVFCVFLAAAGAAIRKGTAATVSRVEVNSFFIVVSPSTSGGFFYFGSLPLTTLLCRFSSAGAIALKREFESRILGMIAGKS